DLVQPGSGVRPAVEGLSRAPSPQQGLLDGVLGLVVRREHAVTVHVQLAPMALGEGLERTLVQRRRAHADALWPRSCSTQVLPSGSLKSAKELKSACSGSAPGTQPSGV